jgi:hypothetical protein
MNFLSLFEANANRCVACDPSGTAAVTVVLHQLVDVTSRVAQERHLTGGTPGASRDLRSLAVMRAVICHPGAGPNVMAGDRPMSDERLELPRDEANRGKTCCAERAAACDRRPAL